MSGAVKKRSYTSTLRREQAARTRSSIVEAAARLFMERGYARTTVQAIAEEAGVAPDTVYATFGSKIRVLTAVIDSRLAPPGVANVMDRPEAEAVHQAGSQRELLRRFAADMAMLSARVGPIIDVLRGAADAEPEVRVVYEEMEGYRLANMRRVVEWLAAKGPLAMDAEEAARTVWAIAGPETGRLLCRVGGWTEEQHAGWLAATLVATLLPPRARRA